MNLSRAGLIKTKAAASSRRLAIKAGLTDDYLGRLPAQAGIEARPLLG
jgi:hypothetical protein